MSKEKAMDKLAQDAIAARKAGVSYGQYKAMQSPVKIIPKTQKTGIRKICPNCGKEFYQVTVIEKKYCDSVCRDKYWDKRRREERRKASGTI